MMINFPNEVLYPKRCPPKPKKIQKEVQIAESPANGDRIIIPFTKSTMERLLNYIGFEEHFYFVVDKHGDLTHWCPESEENDLLKLYHCIKPLFKGKDF